MGRSYTQVTEFPFVVLSMILCLTSCRVSVARSLEKTWKTWLTRGTPPIHSIQLRTMSDQLHGVKSLFLVTATPSYCTGPVVVRRQASLALKSL